MRPRGRDLFKGYNVSFMNEALSLVLRRTVGGTSRKRKKQYRSSTIRALEEFSGQKIPKSKGWNQSFIEPIYEKLLERIASGRF